MLFVVVLSPVLWLVLMSLRQNSEIMSTTLAFRPTLRNYAEAWTGEFPASFGHSLSASIWTMKGFFDAVPRSLEEAAWIDGAGLWGAFAHVALPLAAPGLAATGILCFVLSWNDFFFALILTRTEAMTAPVAIVNFMQYAGFEWGKIAAGGVSVMLPVLLFTVLVRRYLVSGLTAGGVKE